MSEELIARLSDGSLLPVVVQDSESKEVLMLAWINSEALALTEKTRRATFWSRSRNEIWLKGDTSGNYQEVISIKFDCDSDALLYLVQPHGPACHTGERTCFYREMKIAP